MMHSEDGNVAGNLSELRKRLIYILIVFLLVLAVSMVYISKIYDYAVHPVTAMGYRLVVMSPGEAVWVYLSMGGVVALCCSMPVAVFQIWRFVAPGLLPGERRLALRLLPPVSVMFSGGVGFAWFIVLPNILRFLLNLSSAHFTVLLRASSYFSFVTTICLALGSAFELPVAVVFLTQIGVVTPKLLNSKRRYAYLAIVAMGVLISPPELISHLSVVLPMMALYELAIFLSVITVRRQRNALQKSIRQESMSNWNAR